ncbi:MAG: fibronectin type III domain-containing protein [Bacillota bacterium]
MKRRFMLLVCGFLILTLLLPFQAAAAEADSAVVAESSKSGVTMVAAGEAHSLALKEDGTVWAWGYGLVLGHGSYFSSTTPVQVKDLEEVVMVAAGHDHSLALKSDGTVWAWGSSEYGNLGEDPDNRYRLTPIQVKGLSSIVAIAASGQHNLALKSDGTVWAWGNNGAGQLGNGTVTDHLTYFTTPAQVRGLDSVTAVAAGPGTSLAIKSDGTLWAWGGNVGDGTTDLHSTPVQVQGLSSVVSIATAGHSLAVKSDGTLWAWGGNYHGQLGDGTTTDRTIPVQVQSLSSVAAIAADEWHSLALKSDGTVWEWGCNLKGGECYESDIRNTPVQVQDLSSAVGIAAGYEHSLAVKSDGTVWAWGWNGSGQLGDAARSYHSTPVQVLGLGESGPTTPEPPQWPEGDVLTVTDVTYNSVRLNWQPATDDTGVYKYFVYKDNALRAALDGDVNSYEVKGLSPNSSYLFSLVAIDAYDNQSVKQEVTVTTAAYAAPGPFQLSDSKTYSYGGSNYEFLLYYGYISSSGQELSGSWSPPEGFHGVVKVSMASPEGEDYDLSLETVGEGNRLPEDTTLLTNGTEYSAAEVPGGYRAEWRVKGHTGNDYSRDKKVFVYVSIKYDNH